jgi:hypothetical protein
MTARPKVCVDRLPPGDQMRRHRIVSAGNGQRAIALRTKPWPNGSVLRVRFLGGTRSQRDKATTEALWWTASANVAFVFDDAPDAELRIAFEPEDGAWSYVGTDCRTIPLDQPTMNLGFLDDGTAAHEFGHAIGLAHEHQNPAAGITWNEQRVIEDLSGPPNHWTEAQIRHNVLNKYSFSQIMGTGFDPDSIMLYFFPGSWVSGGVGTHANNTLSKLDREFVGSAGMYPFLPPAEQQLTIDTPRRTRARITAAGRQDLYVFDVAVDGTYVIDTKGTEDLVMTLFGPDDRTAVIAVDDNAGIGLNPRIVADLVPGRYLVQVRHHSPADTDAEYTIRVRTAPH